MAKEELLEVFGEDGRPTGKGVARSLAHREGILHGASHILICKQEFGRLWVLLQRRSANKDSYPGCLDISSAGHIEHGSDFLPTALKELSEELGIRAEATDLVELFTRRVAHDEVFYGRPFVDREFNRVYLLTKAVDISQLTLQASEVSEVVWMDASEAIRRLEQGDRELCMIPDAFKQAIAAATTYYREGNV